ncbi:P2Y purinoceptor 1-like isoform X1 [Perca fluviatilis]|uniref:P2Y purinoceptor 1-like isoform X1 n=1 Tax=Perca fluviatilis TaxID=8168 RepID=UPI001963E2D8|nr:P2Y purinoceptor 1-like isoform X1 [Perca fluviatilis]
MTNASCQSIIFDFTGRFLPPVYILVFIIGLVANGWGLKSLLHNWKKLKIINVFVLNLGLADILYLLTLPFLVAYYFMESKWIFGDAFCKITRFCFNLNLYGSIGFLTCISVYRYLAIVHPVRLIGRLTLTHSVRISVMVWFLVSVQSLPDMFYSKTFGNNTEKCFDTTSNIYVDDYLKYSLGWTVNGFCIPLLITLGCYGHVIVVLCSTNTTDKVLKLLFIVILLFSVCYIPYHVLKNLNLWSRVLQKQKICRKWSNGVYIAPQISRGLVCLNSALNPLVYLHGNEDIPAQLRQLLQQVRQMFSRPPPTNSAGVPMAQITDGARVKLCKLRAPQDWKEREERKTRGKTWGWRCVCVCVCLEVEMGSREEECETFLMPVQRLFTR